MATKPRDYVPGPDAEFDLWQKSLLSALKKESAKFGLSNASDSELGALQAAWTTEYAAHLTAQTSAQTRRAAKDTARAAYTAALRRQVQQTQHTPGVTDADRAALGLNARDAVPTAAVAPTSRPVITIDTSKPLQHTINFFDEDTPTSRAKPAGVLGCEIWFHIGDPAPADPAEFQLAGLDTATPYLKTFDGAHGGKTVHYRTRWLSTRQEPGPWSQAYSATVTA